MCKDDVIIMFVASHGMDGFNGFPQGNSTFALFFVVVVRLLVHAYTYTFYSPLWDPS